MHHYGSLNRGGYDHNMSLPLSSNLRNPDILEKKSDVTVVKLRRVYRVCSQCIATALVVSLWGITAKIICC